MSAPSADAAPVTGDRRFVVAGLAGPRSAWFRDVGRWATSAAIPVEFIRCVSAEELAARIDGGRPFSAALVDAATIGADRDLIDRCVDAGVAVLIVEDDRRRRDWAALGAAASLAPGFDRAALLDMLSRHGRPIERVDHPLDRDSPQIPGAPWSGRLVAVTGGSGAGSSVLSMALAQGLSQDPRRAGGVVLADLALRADQAMYHDAGDVVPALQELVEAHRADTPSITVVRSMLYDTDDRGYHLLLGLRRQRDWPVLRPRSVEATVSNLCCAYRVVVADVDPDLEGEEETGVADIEDRNVLARTALRRADLVVAVGTPELKGLHDLVRVLADLLAAGVDPTRIVPVLNRVERGRRRRAEAVRALADLLAPVSDRLPTPLLVPERRGLAQHLRDAGRLPSAITAPLATAVAALLERTAPPVLGAPEPVAVVPGSLGHFDDA